MNTDVAQTGAVSTQREFLSFRLGAEEYAIDILRVQEIRGYDPVTTLVNAPPFVKGVINLRGVIVPIVDLRVRFRLPAPPYDAFTVVIILEVAGRTVGVVVDGVADVLVLGTEEIRPAPDFSSAVDTRYILGLASRGERLLVVTDIERMMTAADMALIDEAEQQVS